MLKYILCGKLFCTMALGITYVVYTDTKRVLQFQTNYIFKYYTARNSGSEYRARSEKGKGTGPE